jgi:SLA1 homology domain 1, SHD1
MLHELGWRHGNQHRVERNEICARATAPIRTWTDKSDKFGIAAKFAARNGEKIVLEKVDGSTVEINLAVLSDDDQAYIKTFKN